MKLGLNGRIKFRKIVEEKLEELSKGKVLSLDKKLLELLLFEEYKLDDGKIIKIPVWTGAFLEKLDLHEISFDNVLWDVSQYAKYLSKDIPMVSSVNLINTNANIILKRPQNSFNIVSNCTFEGTNLSRQTLYLSEFGNVSDAGLVIMPDCNFKNTGVYVVLDNKVVNENLIWLGEEKKACKQVEEMVARGAFDGCYIDGYLVVNGKITEQKAPIRKENQMEKYEEYQQQLLNKIEKAIEKAK